MSIRESEQNIIERSCVELTLKLEFVARTQTTILLGFGISRVCKRRITVEQH